MTNTYKKSFIINVGKVNNYIDRENIMIIQKDKF